MAQTPRGAMKIAAKKLGLPLEEYESKIAAGLKRCTRCKSWKMIEEFNSDKSRFDGLGAKCRRCGQGTNKPSKTDRKRQRAKGFEWCRGCRCWNPVIEMASRQGACRKCVNRETRQRYAADDRFRHKVKQFVYARKRSVDAVPPEGEIFLLALFDGQCAYCSRSAETWDHIVPVKHGGRTTPGNILPACRSCNSSKKDRDVWDWMKQRGIEPSDLLIDRIAFGEVSLYG